VRPQQRWDARITALSTLIFPTEQEASFRPLGRAQERMNLPMSGWTAVVGVTPTVAGYPTFLAAAGIHPALGQPPSAYRRQL
jgi:hypothetical protein